MEKEKIRDKQVALSPALFTEFERMADGYGLTNKGLLEAMIRFFKATKADPRNPKAEHPTEAIKALDKRLVSFIRQQEKDILKPMSDEMTQVADELYGLKDTVKELHSTFAMMLLRQLGTALRPELVRPEFLTAWENDQERRRKAREALDNLKKNPGGSQS
ncbi:BfmA/BtgA family mobilization protein [Larkinella bovis]|uniref:BfmA/BtgA family mobilization protein n=1 Tax=Larkinella bovis TaxID=683041 RepID=A0ABW0II81_9BACT